MSTPMYLNFWADNNFTNSFANMATLQSTATSIFLVIIEMLLIF